MGEGGHEFALGQLSHPADTPECATQRPAPGASCRDEGKEMNLIGKISGHYQLQGGGSPAPSLPLSHPFTTRRLIFDPSYYHSHKSVDPFFVLPKDLANKETFVRSFLHSLFMPLVVISI